MTTTLLPAVIDVMPMATPGSRDHAYTPVTMPTSSASQHFTLPSLHKLISRGGRGLSQSITSVTVSTVVMGASCPRRVFTWAQRTQVYSSRVSYNPGKGGHLRTGRPPPLLRAIEVSHAQHVIQATVTVLCL